MDFPIWSFRQPSLPNPFQMKIGKRRLSVKRSLDMHSEIKQINWPWCSFVRLAQNNCKHEHWTFKYNIQQTNCKQVKSIKTRQKFIRKISVWTGRCSYREASEQEERRMRPPTVSHIEPFSNSSDMQFKCMQSSFGFFERTGMSRFEQQQKHTTISEHKFCD